MEWSANYVRCFRNIKNCRCGEKLEEHFVVNFQFTSEFNFSPNSQFSCSFSRSFHEHMIFPIRSTASAPAAQPNGSDSRRGKPTLPAVPHSTTEKLGLAFSTPFIFSHRHDGRNSFRNSLPENLSLSDFCHVAIHNNRTNKCAFNSCNVSVVAKRATFATYRE